VRRLKVYIGLMIFLLLGLDLILAGFVGYKFGVRKFLKILSHKLKEIESEVVTEEQQKKALIQIDLLGSLLREIK
jgi:hypothetical protein